MIRSWITPGGSTKMIGWCLECGAISTYTEFKTNKNHYGKRVSGNTKTQIPNYLKREKLK